jgi:hypothetical protein
VSRRRERFFLRHRAVVVLPGRIEEEILAEEGQRLAGFALDVAQRREGLVILRRRVAIRAVLAEPHVRVSVPGGGRPVRGPSAPAEPAPEPPVIRGLAVAHHQGNALVGLQISVVVIGTRGRRRRIHLLDDHGAVGNRRRRSRPAGLRPVRLEPVVHLGRVPHEHRRRVRAERSAGPFVIGERPDKWAGVADALVDLPAGGRIAVAVMLHERGELFLITVERQRARPADVLRERPAQRPVEGWRRILGGDARRLRADARRRPQQRKARRAGADRMTIRQQASHHGAPGLINPRAVTQGQDKLRARQTGGKTNSPNGTAGGYIGSR